MTVYCPELEAAAKQSAQPREFTLKNGEVVKAVMSDLEAYQICKSLTGDFARKLCSEFIHGTRELSYYQLGWLHKLANEKLAEANQAAKPVPKGTDLGGAASLLKIKELFSFAGAKLKNPSIALATKAGLEISLSLAKLNSKNPGAIYLKSADGEYLGKIMPDGVLLPTAKCTDDVKELLVEFAANPAKVAAEYGKSSGRCCFCCRKLTDDRSKEVGYGKTCAKNYGQPY
jgi:hypothetical protein